MHGRLQRLSAKQESERAEDGLSDEYREHQYYYRNSILDEDFGVYKHTYGDEEYRSEEVLHRLHEFYDVLCLDGLGEDAAHHKGSESARETHLGAKHRHTAAEPERHDEQRLVVDEASHGAQEQRDEEDAYDKPQYKEEPYLHNRVQHLPAVGAVAAGDGAQHHHHNDGEDVLKDKDAHHHSRETLLPQS